MTEIPPAMIEDGQAQPDVAELLQEELAGKAVLVRLDAPATVHELPSRRARYYTETVGTDLVHILHADAKRKKGWLVAATAFRVSHKGSAGSGGLWPANVPLPITHWSDVWIAATADTLAVTVAIEVWAD